MGSSKKLKEFNTLFKKSLGTKKIDTCIIILTKYGSGGSYDSKHKEILINIFANKKEQLIEIIVHEIIHIGIQNYIDIYKLSHWQKERLVDLLCEKYFPGLRQLQKISEDVSKVETSFATYMPDIDLVSKNIQ